MSERGKRLAMAILWWLPPAVVACLVGAVGLQIGSIIPWDPFALDLGIYRRAGVDLLAGRDFYLTPQESWPFIYPPFAALLAVPLAWMSWTVTTIVWPALNAALLMAIGYRFGIKGWRLCLLITLAVVVVEPIRITLAFGQINIVLMALVVLDSLPGKRLLGERRWLPEGWLTGLAAAIKLTPGIFAVYQLGVRRWRVAAVTVGTFLLSVVIGFLALPAASVEFWPRLAGGDSGINEGLFHYTNQSVVGNAVRLFGDGAETAALPFAALAGLIGLVAAVAWHRLGQVSLALSLVGFAALVASPISWSHHYVWVLPLGLVLFRSRRELPRLVLVTGILLVAYVTFAPFNALPYAQEETWGIGYRLLNTAGLLLALTFMISCLLVGVRKLRDRTAVSDVAVSSG